ncbi:MFS transporter [Paraburkholderia silviterrae]|uniref:MFS transporter n=1 Tax=Paraburkholderia silviterrae TaxID=2528715 RepID=A0A4R5M0Y7_9BURK|nr:MFS transporter [Paraburkholderia silviterrae]TDG18818.1 MFS transporter [Paraburkholderia silviterrae]
MTEKSNEPGGDVKGRTVRAGSVLALITCFLVIVLDGFNTTSFAFVVPPLAHEWGLVPARFTSVFVATNVGAVLGYVSVGSVARRFGYRFAGTASVVVSAGFTLAATFATNIATLSALRLFAAVGLCAVLPIAITASASIIGPKHKVAASLIMTTGMSVGSVAGGMIGGPLMQHLGWHAIFVLGGILPLVVALPFFLVLSPARCADLMANGARDPAQRAAARPQVLFRGDLAIFTSLLWLFAFLVFMDVFAMLSWIPTLLPSFGVAPARASVGIAAFSFGGLCGNILMTLIVALMALAGRVRLKLALTIGFVLVIAGFVALGRAQLGAAAVLLMIGVIGAGLVNAMMGLTAMAVARYPLQMRATGLGWAHAIGRMGSFVGPAICGELLSLGWSARAIVLIAIVPAVAAMVTLGALALTGRASSGVRRTEGLAQY